MINNDNSDHNCLGCPIPIDEHAVSVCLPKWSDVVGYEEGNPLVISKLYIGYPRFKIHASVEKLANIYVARKIIGIKNDNNSKTSVAVGHTEYSFSYTLDKNTVPSGHTKYSWMNDVTLDGKLTPLDICCFIFPTLSVCARFTKFMKHNSASEEIYLSIEPVGVLGLYCVYLENIHFNKAKSFWQHTGEIISSRQAEFVLKQLCFDLPDITSSFNQGNRKSSFDDLNKFFCDKSNNNSEDFDDSAINFERRQKEAMRNIKHRISDIVGEPESNICVTVSGMSAIYTAYRLMRFLKGYQDPVVVFGFPYLDTLKMMQREEINPAGVHFFGFGDENDIKALEALLEERKISAIFTEFPSNPLLKCHDLSHLSYLASKYDFLLIVDDTISSFANADLLHSSSGPIADIICTSLTKLFSGRGDVLAGSLILNSLSKDHLEMSAILSSGKLDTPDLFYADAEILNINSRTFMDRVYRISETSLFLAEWFVSRKEIQSVYHPGISMGKETYDRFKKKIPKSGYGCLISIVLNTSYCPKKFYDSLDVCKGPSLGTDYTLVCPYVLLAHYNELDWALKFGLNPNIIRISVGLESKEELMSKFVYAFEKAANCC